MEPKYKVHAFYILSIMSATIIGLVTVKWSSITNLVSLITFALTLTSLVLAALAIIYAFVTNGSFQGTIQSLHKTSDEMKASGSRISSVLTAFEEKLDHIPKILKTVEGKVAQTHEMIESFSAKPSSPHPRPTPERNDEITQQMVAEVIARYVGYSSTSGLKVAYLFGLSHSKSHPVNLKEACNSIDSLTYDYAHGFAVATVGVGLFDYNQNDDVFTTFSYNPNLFKAVEDELKVRREHTEDEFKASFDADIKAIQNYFKPNPLTDPFATPTQEN